MRIMEQEKKRIVPGPTHKKKENEGGRRAMAEHGVQH